MASTRLFLTFCGKNNAINNYTRKAQKTGVMGDHAGESEQSIDPKKSLFLRGGKMGGALLLKGGK